MTDVEASPEPPAIMTFAAELVDKNQLLQQELGIMWLLLKKANVPIEQKDMKTRLQEIQLMLFLHMVSILMDLDTLPFTASCYFASFVAQSFRYALEIDIMELMARFVYFVWLSPAMDATTWNSWPAVLFPRNCSNIESWWERLQVEYRVDSDECFCEEYWCVREKVLRLQNSDPMSGVPLRAAAAATGSEGVSGVLLRAADASARDADMTSGVPLRAAGVSSEAGKEKKLLPCLEEELEQIKYRFVQSPIRIVPKMPDLARWIYHDAAVAADAPLPVQRVLQPLRPSASEFDADWGNNDGNQIDVSAENVIREQHVFLLVANANISYDLTLQELLGPSFPKLAEVFCATQLPLPWWMPKKWALDSAEKFGQIPAVDRDAYHFYSSLHYQILGGLVFSSLRPDCVLHPHLRCHMEYHCGRLLAFEVAAGRLGTTRVYDFLIGCGIKFGTNADASWVPRKLQLRTNLEVSLFAAHVHSVWGEKCRVCRYMDSATKEDCFYLVPVACNNQDAKKVCSNCYVALGCGTLCNMYHGVTQKHAKQLVFIALQYLEFQGTANRGTREETQENLGFVDQLLGEAGFKCPNNDHYHSNPHRRLQMFQLPRFFPKFVSDDKKKNMPGVTWVGLFPKKSPYFRSDDIEAWRAFTLSQRCSYTAVERFLLSLKKYEHCRAQEIDDSMSVAFN